MEGHQDRSLVGRVAGAVTGKVVQVVPPQVILDHIDIDEFLERVDVNKLLDRVDVNRLLARVDVDALLSEADVEALVRRAGIPAIVAETTNSMAGGTLDTARRQLVGLDTLLTRLVDRVLRRSDTTMTSPELLSSELLSPAFSAALPAGVPDQDRAR